MSDTTEEDELGYHRIDEPNALDDLVEELDIDRELFIDAVARARWEHQREVILTDSDLPRSAYQVELYDLGERYDADELREARWA